MQSALNGCLQVPKWHMCWAKSREKNRDFFKKNRRRWLSIFLFCCKSFVNTEISQKIHCFFNFKKPKTSRHGHRCVCALHSLWCVRMASDLRENCIFLKKSRQTCRKKWLFWRLAELDVINQIFRNFRRVTWSIASSARLGWGRITLSNHYSSSESYSEHFKIILFVAMRLLKIVTVR